MEYKDLIYMDNAATTPVSDSVLEAMLPFLKNQYGRQLKMRLKQHTKELTEHQKMQL